MCWLCTRRTGGSFVDVLSYVCDWIVVYWVCVLKQLKLAVVEAKSLVIRVVVSQRLTKFVRVCKYIYKLVTPVTFSFVPVFTAKFDTTIPDPTPHFPDNHRFKKTDTPSPKYNQSTHTSINNTVRSTSSNTFTVDNLNLIQIYNPSIDTKKNDSNKYVENIKQKNLHVLSHTNFSRDSHPVNYDPLTTLETLPTLKTNINFQHTTSQNSLITKKTLKTKMKKIYTIPVLPLQTIVTRM